jgi:predicted patatin/cPLA2 family phospholipase
MQVTVVVRRGLLRRVLQEWAKLVEHRKHKVQFDMFQSEIQRLENRCHVYQCRPIHVLKNRRLRNLLWMWWSLSAARRSRRTRGEKAIKHMMQRNLVAAWNAW